MTARHDDIATRWANREMGRDDRPNFRARRDNMFGEDGALYSYGHHFELARPLRTDPSDRDYVSAWLLNADRYSVTTTRHQSTVRNVLARTGRPMILLPYDALSSAGIDRDTIRPVDVTEDGWERIPHRSTTRPEGARMVTHNVTKMVDLTDDELAAVVDKRNADAVEEWETRKRWADEADEGNNYWRTWLENNPEPRRYTIDDLQPWDRQEHRVVGTRDQWYVGRGSNPLTRQDDGTWTWETTRHWLGASLFRAAVRTGPTRRHRRWAYFLSAFDEQESTPLYFLAELPRDARPTTVAEAVEALKPEVVKVAEIMGRDVTRQGDIFAVPMPGLDKRALRKAGATFERRKANTYHVGRWSSHGSPTAALLGQNHYATEVARMPDGTTYARGTLWHDPLWRAPDHARRRMGDGKTWHLIVKNTVPVAK